MPHYEGPETPRAVDFFAGAGGFTEGLLEAGVNVTHAFEKDQMARLTYHVRHSEPNNISVHPDAADIDSARFPEPIDIIVGGPPCQNFSTNGTGCQTDLYRNKLPFVMVEWAKRLDPTICILENVEGMKSTDEDILGALRDQFEDIEYNTSVITLNAEEYGVPQQRRRVFLIAIDKSAPQPDIIEPPTVCNEGQQRFNQLSRGESQSYLTAKEAIEDLPAPLSPQHPADDPIHTTLSDLTPEEFTGRYTNCRVDPRSYPEPVTRNGTEVFIPPNHVEPDHSLETRKKNANRELGRNKEPTTSRRLHPDKPAPTITFSSATPPIHYYGQAPSKPNADIEDVRRLTVREMARLQGFMDSYTFAGTKTEQSRQVANAVPPPVARALGRYLRKTVFESNETESSNPELPTPTQ